jgi:pyruvate carboxylase subunit B
VAVFSAPITTSCTVVEGSTTRRFRITIEPPDGMPAPPAPAGAPRKAIAPGPPAGVATAVPVFSPFEGKTELVEIKVKAGDVVTEGQVVASVEAMKAKHDVRAPCGGRVVSVDAELGTTVMAGKSILTIGG